MVKISIITLTYNSADTIRDTLTSIHNQNFLDFEHIIIDGNSSDQTLEICQSFNSNRIKIFNRPPEGIYAALNYGVSKAGGDYISVLHSDDEFASENILAQIVSISDVYKPKLIYGDVCFLSENKNKTVRYWRSSTYAHWKKSFGWMPPHTSCFFLRSMAEKITPYETTLTTAADYEYLLRFLDLCRSQDVYYFPKLITKMKIGGQSTGTFFKSIRNLVQDYKVLRRRYWFPCIPTLGKRIIKISQFI